MQHSDHHWPDYDRVLSGETDYAPDAIEDAPQRTDEVDGIEPVHERGLTTGVVTDIIGFAAGSFVVAATIFSFLVAS